MADDEKAIACVEAFRPLAIAARKIYQGQIRCHSPFCSFDYSPPDCEMCHGTGWHYCRCDTLSTAKE